MKSYPNFSRFGGFIAMLASLMLNADTCAQDVGVPNPQAACAATAPLPNLAALSPDGEYSAVATPDGRVRLCRTQEGARRRILHLCDPRAVMFSSDGRFLAVAGGGKNCSGTIKVWRVADGALLCKAGTDGGIDPQMSFSPDGKFLVSACKSSRINLWQLADGTLKWSETIPHPVARLAFSNEGRDVVAILTDNSLLRFAVR